MELGDQNTDGHFRGECRICLEEEDTIENLISPCQCKGTHRYVHVDCLSEWRKRFSRMHIHRHYCSVCKTHFQTPVSGYVTMGATPEHRIGVLPNPPPPPVVQRRPAVHRRRTWPNVFLYVIIQCCSGVIMFGYFMTLLTTSGSTRFWVVHNVGNTFTVDNIWILVHFGSMVIQTCCFASLTSEPVHLLTLSGLSIYFIFFTPFMVVIFNVLLLITNSVLIFHRLPRR
jgi:hypothetical protein